MARSSVQLEGEEIEYFHSNYIYMWKKLNTAPYYINGSGETPSWIHDPWLLPSYVNLSKCMNPAFVPSINLVNKIVQFYNANIKPEIDTFVFLHERLQSADTVRSAVSYADASAYCGLYRCYYYSGIATRKQVYGAMMRIQAEHDSTSVQMITGITCDDDLNSSALKELITQNDLTPEKYTAYRDSLELSKRRTALYHGLLSVAPGMLSAEMQSPDREGSACMLRLPAVPGVDGRFLGSLGLMMLLNGQDLQILKFALERADEKALKPISLDNEQLSGLLNIEKTENEHIHLAVQSNATWNDLILEAGE